MDIYREIANQDNFPVDGSPYGYINWLESDVCVSLCCRCGYEGYYDGDYFGYYECPQCHTKYAVGQRVKLIPLDKHQVEEIGETQFKTCMVSTGAIEEFKGWDVYEETISKIKKENSSMSEN